MLEHSNPHQSLEGPLMQGQLGGGWMHIGTDVGACWSGQQQNNLQSSTGWSSDLDMTAPSDGSSGGHQGAGVGLAWQAEIVAGEAPHGQPRLPHSGQLIPNGAISWMPVGNLQGVVTHVWGGALPGQGVLGSNGELAPGTLIGPQGGQMGSHAGGLGIAGPDVFGIRMGILPLTGEQQTAVDGNVAAQEQGATIPTQDNVPVKSDGGIGGISYTNVIAGFGEPPSGSTSTGPGTPEQYASYPVPPTPQSVNGTGGNGNSPVHDWEGQFHTYG